jgi:uncharacterized membrane protein
MNVILDNISSMGFHTFLAIIPILFGWLILKTRQKFLKVAFAIIWLSFLPNTLYIFTDLHYVPGQWNTISYFGKIVLALQYIVYEIIGFSSFILALYPLEKMLLISQWRKKKCLLSLCLIAVNFLIGFGIVLGRIQRINSWDIFINAPKVINASLQILSSSELMLLVLLFGLFANLFYFLFRNLREVIAAPASRSR